MNDPQPDCACPDCEAECECPHPRGDGANFHWTQERECAECGDTFAAEDPDEDTCAACWCADPMEPDYDALAEVEPTTATELENCAYPVGAVGGC